MSMYAVKRSLSMDLVLIFSLDTIDRPDATYAHTPEGVWAALTTSP